MQLFIDVVEAKRAVVDDVVVSKLKTQRQTMDNRNIRRDRIAMKCPTLTTMDLHQLYLPSVPQSPVFPSTCNDK
jgi:hypothetical protein